MVLIACYPVYDAPFELGYHHFVPGGTCFVANLSAVRTLWIPTVVSGRVSTGLGDISRSYVMVFLTLAVLAAYRLFFHAILCGFCVVRAFFDPVFDALPGLEHLAPTPEFRQKLLILHAKRQA
jgi:hypothetical protein